MKKSRFLAVILCVMLVFTAVTPMAVMAEDYSDYVPDADAGANILVDPDHLNHITRSNGTAGSHKDWQTGQYFRWEEKAAAANTYWGAGPTFNNISYGNLNGEIIEGKTYKLSVRLKNDTVSTRPTLKFGFTYGTGTTPISFDVTSSEYETFTATFTATKTASNINYGFDATVDRSGLTDLGILNMDISNGGSFYVGEFVAVHDLSLESDSSVLESGESINLTAKILDSSGAENEAAEAEFDYYAVNAGRTQVVTGFNFDVSQDTKAATVTMDSTVNSGTYVLIAEDSSLGISGFRKGIEIVVENTQVIADTIESVKTETADELATNLDGYLSILAINDDYVISADTQELANVIADGIAEETIETKEDMQEYIRRAAIVALYNVPASDIALYGEDGSFNYADELKLSDIDTAGVTLYSATADAIAAEGMTALQTQLSGKDFANYAEFITELQKELVLRSISNPALSGVNYLNAVLTEANLALVGVDGTNYLALGNNIQFLREQIRGNTFTIETLEAALASAYESDIAVLNADYVPESMPANLIAAPNGYNYGGGNSGDVGGGWAAGTDNTQVAFTVKNDFAYTSGATWITHGLKMEKPKYGEGENKDEDLKPNTTYVYKTSIKAVGDTAPYFNITYHGNVSKVTTNEYGTTGYAPGAVYEDFKATFNTGSNVSGSFWIGLSSGIAGNDVYQNITNAEQYLAPEAAYDMEVSAAAASVPAGEILNVEAGVLNQLGLDYSGTPTFSYYAVTEDRSADAQGFTFTPSADTKSVQVSVDATVPLGKYVIIAEETALGIDGFKKGITIEVTKPVIRDTEPGTDPLYEITLNPVSGSTTMGVFDSLTLEAKLVDSLGAVGTNPQSFTWYALNAERTDKLTEGIILTPSGDTTALDVALDAALAEGTYYIVAEAQGLRKSIALTVDKTNDISDIIYRIGNETAAGLAPDMATVVELLEIGDTYAAKADASNLATVITAGVGAENLTDKASLAEYVKRAAVVSLYNIPASDVSLTDANGNFVYEAELKLSGIDTNEVTLYAGAMTEMSAAGKSKLKDALTGKSFATYADFMTAVKANLLLIAIANPKDDGTAYLDTVITPANLALLGVDGTNYFALSNASDFKLTKLKGQTFTLQTLAATLAAAYETPTGTNNGSTGGGVTGGGVSGGSGDSGGGSLSFGGGSSSGKDDNKGEGSQDSAALAGEEFTDVAKTHWAYSDIHYLRSIGVIAGTTATTYDPDAIVTREQLLKLIMEAFKLGTSNASTQFVDIDSAAWYAPYVKGGVALGIVNGKSATEFGVGEAVTRQDACVMIDRALSLSGDISEEIGFKDAAEIAEYAKSAVAALAGYGIVNGVGDNSFDPRGVCTRAQAAKIISSALSISNSLNLSGR